MPFVALAGAHRDGVLAVAARDGSVLRAPLRVRMTVDNGVVARDLATQGLGAALAIRAAVARDLRAGRLARVLPGYDAGSVAVRILARDRYPAPPARAFMEFLAARPPPRGTS